MSGSCLWIDKDIVDKNRWLANSPRVKKFQKQPMIAAGMAFALACGSITIVNAETPKTPTDVAVAPAGAEKTASGLASKIVTKGTGTVHPGDRDEVTVHYSGWTTDGKMFDSSVKRGTPATFPLNGVIKGWTEGVQLMVEGEKRRFWIPADLAYGENPGGGRPGGMLCFDIELLTIKKAPEAPKTPENVAAAPADAEKTASGLQSKVIQKGGGDKKAAANDLVTMHFTVWTADGKLLESSTMQGDPITAPPGKLQIPGWKEGVMLMVKGEKRRLWIHPKEQFVWMLRLSRSKRCPSHPKSPPTLPQLQPMPKNLHPDSLAK